MLFICWAVWSVHFLCGEHHDRWYCQSAVVKSCLSDGLVSLSLCVCLIMGREDNDCLGDAIADGRGVRRNGVSALLRVIVHPPSQRGVWRCKAVTALQFASADHGGESDCARHRV